MPSSMSRSAQPMTPSPTFRVAWVLAWIAGRGYALADILEQMCDILGYRVITEVDATLVRPTDIPYLVGNATSSATITTSQARNHATPRNMTPSGMASPTTLLTI